MSNERYKVWLPEVGQTEADATEMNAVSVQAAAEGHASYTDWMSREFHIAKAGHGKVLVKTPDGETKTVIISVETRPIYRGQILRRV